MKLTSKEALDLLKESFGMTIDNKWLFHSLEVGRCASILAKALGLSKEYARTLGYIHDIGKRYGWRKNDGVIPHAIRGYRYLKELGYDEIYAGICLKHSFLNNDIDCLSNDRDETDKEDKDYLFIKDYIANDYTICDKIINLCDLMCTTKVETLEKRMIDLLLRHGVYKQTHYHLKEVFKLKNYFDNLLGYNLYHLFPELKENL